MRTSLLSICILRFLIGCSSTPKVDIAKETEMLRELEDQWSAAVTKKDIETNLSFISPDAYFMDPNIPAYQGPEAFRKALTVWFDDKNLLFDTYRYEIDNIEVSASGDLAYVRGHSEITKNTPDGPALVHTKFIDIWKKIDGNWKCVLNIGNNH